MFFSLVALFELVIEIVVHQKIATNEIPELYFTSLLTPKGPPSG